jgi:hypothetical protein
MRVLSTYTSYQLIARDIDRSLNQVRKQPIVDRETKYYLANITKVKTVDEFVSDHRLFNYAMKAHGLADMAYAKAFMIKALKEGVSDPNSFANKLADKRYAEFVKSYNFATHNESTTVYNPAQQGTTGRYLLQAVQAGISPDDPALKSLTAEYLAGISKIGSIDEFLANDKLYSYALTAWDLADKIGDKAFIRKLLEGGVADPESFANKQTDKKYAAFAAAFDFAALGEKATTYVPAQHGAVDKYLRQTLEENAGARNEGVRLALYFQRKAPTLKTAYQILSDPALSKVVRAALGLPEAMAQADVDQQAKLLNKRINLADFADPEKLGKFLARFSAMWEATNGPTITSPTAMLFSQPPEFGISTDALLALQQLRK